MTDNPYVHYFGWAVGIIFLIGAAALLITTFLAPGSGDGGYPAEQETPTKIDRVTFWYNGSTYIVRYTPVGDERTVVIAPMIRTGGFDLIKWVTYAKPGIVVTQAAPIVPVEFVGRRGDAYGRFEISVERNGAMTTQYFDYPITTDLGRA